MRKILSVFALAGLMALGVQGTAKAFDIKFTNYCDGLNINYGTDLSATGASIGSCLTNRPANGNFNIPVSPAIVYGTTMVVSSYAGTPDRDLVFSLDFFNFLFYLYENGVLINSGAWTYGTPAASATDAPASGG